MSTIWYDGRLVKRERIKVSILSHALHYGTGAFEGIRVYDTSSGPAIFRLNDHVERLFKSAGSFGVRIPYSKTEIGNAIRKVVAANRLREGYIRPLIFFGEGNMGLGLGNVKMHFAIAAWPWGAYLGEHPTLSVGVSSYIRFHPKSVVPGSKLSGLYAISTLATTEAHKRGFDECVLLDYKGNIAEGPGENIFIIKRRALFTPKRESILPGITRDSIMAIARDMDLRVYERDVSPSELMHADEAFLTGTAAEVAPIGKVNKKRIGDGGVGPLTEMLRTAYKQIVHGELPQYRRWLTSVNSPKKAK